MQVDCDPPGNMIVRVSSIIPAYSYMRLAILEVRMHPKVMHPPAQRPRARQIPANT